MSHILPLAPLPWVLALLIFGFLSHARDHANFLEGPNMALAALCGLTLASYLVVNFTGLLSAAVAIGYLLAGILLFAGAVGGIVMGRSL